jgi:hypothetical protein
MVNKFAAIGLGALIALSPLAAVAQTDQAAPGAAGAAAPAAKTGTHRAMTQHKSRQRSRASAHHMHKMSKKPAASSAPPAANPQ